MRVKRQLLRLGVTVVTRILLISPPHVAASLLTVPVLAGLSKLAVSNPYIYLHMYKTSLLCSTKSLGFVYRFAAVYGFGKPGKSAAAAAVTLTTQGEMCTTKTKKPFGNNS